MPALKKSIQLRVSIRDVWKAISNPQHLPDWDPTISDVATLGTAGEGQRIDYTVNGTSSIFAFVIRSKEPSLYAYQYNQMGITWEVRYELQAHGSATHLQRKLTAKGILGWVIWGWQKHSLEEQERQIILRIKAKLESDAPA